MRTFDYSWYSQFLYQLLSESSITKLRTMTVGCFYFFWSLDFLPTWPCDSSIMWRVIVIWYLSTMSILSLRPYFSFGTSAKKQSQNYWDLSPTPSCTQLFRFGYSVTRYTLCCWAKKYLKAPCLTSPMKYWLLSWPALPYCNLRSVPME